MKVISIKEPFATLIKENIKSIETRSWKTKYRGEILIHASLTKYNLDFKNDEFVNLTHEYIYNPGFILCKANLVDCVEMTIEFIDNLKYSNYVEYISGRYEVGRYAWILQDVTVINPVKAKGQLGLWNYDM